MDNDKIIIFLVDDNALYLKSLEAMFTGLPQFEVHAFTGGKDCLANLGKKPDIIVLDHNLSEHDRNESSGLTILRKIKQADQNVQVIILSSQDKIEVAVNCMKEGAFDYIVKNETALVRLKIAIKNVFAQHKLSKSLSSWDW